MRFVPFATFAGSPSKISTGSVISEPLPASVLMNPATMPVMGTAASSQSRGRASNGARRSAAWPMGCPLRIAWCRDSSQRRELCQLRIVAGMRHRGGRDRRGAKCRRPEPRVHARSRPATPHASRALPPTHRVANRRDRARTHVSGCRHADRSGGARGRPSQRRGAGPQSVASWVPERGRHVGACAAGTSSAAYARRCVAGGACCWVRRARSCLGAAISDSPSRRLRPRIKPRASSRGVRAERALARAQGCAIGRAPRAKVSAREPGEAGESRAAPEHERARRTQQRAARRPCEASAPASASASAPALALAPALGLRVGRC